MGRQIRVTAVLLLGLLLVSSGVTWAGPMFFSGDDSDSTAHCPGTLCGGLLAKALKAVYDASTGGGTGILAIMTNTSSTARTALIGWNSTANGGPNATITYVSTAAQIAAVNFSLYRMIYVPSASNLTSGGITSSQVGALNTAAVKAKILNFVNSGGGVLALSEQGLTGGFGWLPVPLTFATITDTNVQPTLDMFVELPTTTGSVTSANMDHFHYHNSWSGTFGDLKVLATTQRTSGINVPVIVGRITPVNRAPTDILLSNNTIAENAGANAVVGTLSGTDPDAGQSATLTFSLPAGVDDNAAFNVSGTSLRANASFNFETTSSYLVTVRATDTGAPGLTFNKQFTINVTNANEAPTDILLSNNTIAENAGADAVVGTLSGTDPDAGQSATLTFSLPGGVDDNGSFNISGTSLRANASFNFETQSSYLVTVRATDSGAPGLTFDKQFNITVSDVPEAVDFATGFNFPFGVAVDNGNVYIADRNNHVVWKVDSIGAKTRVAGRALPPPPLPGEDPVLPEGGYNGEGTATTAQLNSPTGVAVDASGNLFIADSGNHIIRKVSNGTITTVAGTPTTFGLAVNGGPATSATLYVPRGVAVDAAGNLYIADTMNQQVRVVIATGADAGKIFAVAGVAGETGDIDGSVAAAKLNSPLGVAVYTDINNNTFVFIADEGNDRIRIVPGGTVDVDTVVAPGIVEAPSGVAVDANGTLYIADTNNHRIVRVSGATVDIVAGSTATPGEEGSGANQLNSPVAVAISADGCVLYIADLINQRIQKVVGLCVP